MPAAQGASPHRSAVFPPGGRLLRRGSLRTRARAAAGLWTAAALLAGAALAGCEYSYDEEWRPADDASAPADAERESPPDWWQNDPVSETELAAWLEESQLGSGLQVAHRSYGLLRTGEVRADATAALPAGTYVLALACRSQRRVAFTVRDEDSTLVDLSLRCGSRRDSVVHLSRESVITFRVEARSAANFAFRLNLL